jgi:hypothetical protein
MNTKLYETWIKSRQMEPVDLDITDSVMERITQKACRPGVLQQAKDVFWLDWIGAKRWVQTCMFVLGALMGLFRMMLQIYSLLFI